MKSRSIVFMTLVSLSQVAVAASPEEILNSYRSESGIKLTQVEGDRLWQFSGKDGRICADCHGANLQQPGKHVRTGKKIEPLAPSINGKRFTDLKKVEKWFKRNCKWTWGRECTAGEKGHLLSWMMAQ